MAVKEIKIATCQQIKRILKIFFIKYGIGLNFILYILFSPSLETDTLSARLLTDKRVKTNTKTHDIKLFILIAPNLSSSQQQHIIIN